MPAASDSTQLTGTVVVTGTDVARYTTLRIEGKPVVTLVGPLEPELRRLGAATVRVTGEDAGSGPAGRRLAVGEYEVLSINGERPYVGVLLVQDDRLALATASDTLPLSAAPQALRQHAGAKLWVTGQRTDTGVELQSYGVIRPNPR
ncbi:MAG TPA: hypothetical protein VFW98_15245 [Gemmatimonadaceae bacterium]|nr:hypothetical protein [Gemmatimonadaceae bacterium]